MNDRHRTSCCSATSCRSRSSPATATRSDQPARRWTPLLRLLAGVGGAARRPGGRRGGALHRPARRWHPAFAERAQPLRRRRRSRYTEVVRAAVRALRGRQRRRAVGPPVRGRCPPTARPERARARYFDFAAARRRAAVAREDQAREAYMAAGCLAAAAAGARARAGRVRRLPPARARARARGVDGHAPAPLARGAAAAATDAPRRQLPRAVLVPRLDAFAGYAVRHAVAGVLPAAVGAGARAARRARSPRGGAAPAAGASGAVDRRPDRREHAVAAGWPACAATVPLPDRRARRAASARWSRTRSRRRCRGRAAARSTRGHHPVLRRDGGRACRRRRRAGCTATRRCRRWCTTSRPARRAAICARPRAASSSARPRRAEDAPRAARAVAAALPARLRRPGSPTRRHRGPHAAWRAIGASRSAGASSSTSAGCPR